MCCSDIHVSNCVFFFLSERESVLYKVQQSRNAQAKFTNHCLRWLRTVSSTLQDVDFDGS